MFEETCWRKTSRLQCIFAVIDGNLNDLKYSWLYFLYFDFKVKYSEILIRSFWLWAVFIFQMWLQYLQCLSRLNPVTSGRHGQIQITKQNTMPSGSECKFHENILAVALLLRSQHFNWAGFLHLWSHSRVILGFNTVNKKMMDHHNLFPSCLWGLL